VLEITEMTHVHEANSITEQLIADPDFLTAIQIAADQIEEKRKRNNASG
jgi:hypothetical protein